MPRPPHARDLTARHAATRAEEEIAAANDVNMSELRDPQTDAERVVKEETLVLLGVCTLTLTLTNPNPNPNQP